MREHMESDLVETCEIPAAENQPTCAVAQNVAPVAMAHSPSAVQVGSLTAREREILELLSQGHSYKMMGAELNLAMGTIQIYIVRIYRKLHVHCRLGAMLKYVAATGLSASAFLQD